MRITTPRLVLRPLTDADAPALLAYWSEPTVNCFADMKMESVNDAVRYIRDTVHADEHFGVCLHDGTLIGDMLADKDGPDTYGLVWSLNPRYQGKGYALEAAKAFLGYLFERAGARRVYAPTSKTTTFRRANSVSAWECASKAACASLSHS